MILYFSGTGNSLYVAKKLAELTGDTAVPISAIHERCQRIQDRIIGFVFPVYFGDLPDPVQDFIRQVRFQKSTYFYGIATCGSTAGRALKKLTLDNDTFENTGKSRFFERRTSRVLY